MKSEARIAKRSERRAERAAISPWGNIFRLARLKGGRQPSNKTTGGIYWVSLCYLDILVGPAEASGSLAVSTGHGCPSLRPGRLVCQPAACRFHIISSRTLHSIHSSRRIFTRKRDPAKCGTCNALAAWRPFGPLMLSLRFGAARQPSSVARQARQVPH